MLRIGSLFSGAGGLDLGVESVFDAEPVWFCEFNKDAAKVLEARFPGVPNLHDVTQVDWSTVEPVDMMTGGFPCQDVSSAGLRAGLTDESRSGLWSYYAEAIKALQPKLVVIENVRGLLSATAHRDVEPEDEALGAESDGHILRAAGAVCGDLATIGYDARWKTVQAAWWGAPHQRERVFIIAYPAGSDPRNLLEHIKFLDDGYIGDVDELLPTPDAGTFTRGSAHLMLPTIARLAIGDDTVPNPGMAGAPLPTVRATSGRAQGKGYGPMIEDAVLLAVGDDRTLFKPGQKTLKGNEKLLPTPLAGNPGNTNEGYGDCLNDVLPTLLPTPRSSDKTGGAEHGTGGPDLTTVVECRLFPTPMATDGARNGMHPDVRQSYGIGVSIVQMNDLGVAYGEPEWHQYDGAIKRWEALFRPAPYPVVEGKNGKPQLSARFSEWMMGWPEGWVDIDGLSRRAQLRICGNGVVPQQAAGAIRWMLAEWLDEWS
jgi:DNA (cytosine-5)-methyltransferase 1